MRNEHHVVANREGGWDVKMNNSKEQAMHFDTKAEAVTHARKLSIAAKSELIIHNKNGQIAKRDSHGNDPRSSKG